MNDQARDRVPTDGLSQADEGLGHRGRDRPRRFGLDEHQRAGTRRHDEVDLEPLLIAEVVDLCARLSDGVPIAPVETIVVMKLLAGRTQDLADIEAIVASGLDREYLRAAVAKTAPDRADMLERLFENVDRSR